MVTQQELNMLVAEFADNVAQQTDAIAHEQWDIQMDAICCENATYFREDHA